jgi:small subunit ribosomal protein S5
VSGKCGSVRLELIPAPKGLGLIANEPVKVMLRLAGIKDCWTRSRGSTRTSSSIVFAAFGAIKNTYNIATPKDWAR